MIEVQAQLHAFEAALRHARVCMDEGLPQPRLSVAFDHQGIVHEDSARQHLSHLLATGDVPEGLARRIVNEGDTAPAGAGGEGPTGRLTCAAITTEYFARAAGVTDQATTWLEVFFEESAWSERLAYVRGLQLSHLLGSTTSIRLNLVGDRGQVTRDERIAPRTGTPPLTHTTRLPSWGCRDA
ncbi:hypothetical protein [Stenotrophomonas lacuserhaii]|uniref:hypothetical protein n=1 Tax=Stenotrophomonas lacuserhaii TaxID=2760084 RepID=UPI001C71C57D|nr:hypothetical protein [Stenotrophomonas lacuserhaii]